MNKAIKFGAYEGDRVKAYARHQLNWQRASAIPLLILVAIVLLPVLILAGLAAPKVTAGLMFAAALPIGMPLRDHKGGEGTLTADEFQKKVLDGVGGLETEFKAQKTRADQLVEKFDNLDKTTKKHFEDLTKIKETYNGLDSDFKKALQTIERIQQSLKNEVRQAFGNPIKRIQADEEMRMRFNAAIRLAVNKEGDMLGIVRKNFPSDIAKIAEKELEQKALGEDSSPGSTLINQQLMRELYDTLATYGIWNTFAVRTLGTKTNILPVKTARVVALAIISEGTQVTDDANKAGTTVTATVVDVAALLNVYLRLIEDAEFDVTADVLDDFAEAVAYRLDWFCTQAAGGANTTDGNMTGIFGGGGTTVAAAATHSTVELTTLTDWMNVMLGVDAVCLTRPSRWWMHPQILVRTLGIRDTTGRPIFLTPFDAPSAGGIGTILGYPVTLGHVCPTTNAATNKVVAFGDPNAQVVGIRRGFDVGASDHFKWDYLQRSFRIVGRAATKVRKTSAFGVLQLTA